MNLLFICNQNKNRSKTAEVVFREQFTTKSAGLYNQVPVIKNELAWADLVVVMEEEQRAELAKRFPKEYLQKLIISFDIPDTFEYGNSRLVELLREKLEEFSIFL